MLSLPTVPGRSWRGARHGLHDVEYVKPAFAISRSLGKQGSTLGGSRLLSFPKRAVNLPQAATLEAPLAAPSEPEPIQQTTYTVALFLQGEYDAARLNLTFYSEDDASKKSGPFNLSSGVVKPYKRDDPTAAGTEVWLRLSLPQDLKPGAITLEKLPEPKPENEQPLYVAQLELQPEGIAGPTTYVARSYIDISQGPRIIFPSTRAIPGFPGATPKGLEGFRQQELDILRGANLSPEERKKQRDGSERIYDYDVYNDLGDPTKPDKGRPVLGYGKSGKGNLPYPRRLRTNRPKVDEYETRSVTNIPWIPLDERFNGVKLDAFNDGTSDSLGNLGRSILGTPRGLSLIATLLPFASAMHDNNLDASKPRTLFTSLSTVDALYDGLVKDASIRDLKPVTGLGPIQFLDVLKKTEVWKVLDSGLKSALGIADMTIEEFHAAIEKRKAQVSATNGATNGAGDSGGGGFLGGLFGKRAAQSPASPAAPPPDHIVDSLTINPDTPEGKVAQLVGILKGLLELWPIPTVRDGRAVSWHTDEEFARQAVAGMNPLTIRAMTARDLQDFAVQDSDVQGLLEGKSLAERQAEGGRLWVIDYYTGIIDYVAKANSLPDNKAVMHAGRATFFTRSDGVLIPVAIELETTDAPMRVFTPKDSAEVWFLAKTIWNSLDSGYHQLISHWLTTHACVEPYIIATRRELSDLHPVYKLLMPHFRYTMRLNTNARQSLISVDGTIETGFTPGPFSMELSAVVYDSWRFNETSLPADLLKRGCAVGGKDGKLEITLPGYAFAEDGLLIYEALEKYVGDYLRLYYSDEDGKRVTDDVELVNWWNAVQKEGHPDIKEGWPRLTDIDSLTDILCSIAWTTSCHHAAVNFGQYAYSGYMPNRPSMIRGTIPPANSQAEKKLRNQFEGELLDSITDPFTTLVIMVTVKVLSMHSADEEYLTKEEHNYIKDPVAVKLHTKFVDALNKAEAVMEQRNNSHARLRNGQGMPYTLLMPSNPEVMPAPGAQPPARGVPYSISI